MKTYKELRNAIYILRVEEIGPLKIGTQNFKKNPYTCAKSSLLIELSVILTYFLIRTRVTPNTVTITYGILGLLGAI